MQLKLQARGGPKEGHFSILSVLNDIQLVALKRAILAFSSKRINLPNVLQQVLDRTVSINLPPYKLDQVAVQNRLMSATFPLVPLLCLTPQGSHMISGSMSGWVYKVQRMIYCEVLITYAAYRAVSSPQV